MRVWCSPGAPTRSTCPLRRDAICACLSPAANESVARFPSVAIQNPSSGQPVIPTPVTIYQSPDAGASTGHFQRNRKPYSPVAANLACGSGRPWHNASCWSRQSKHQTSSLHLYPPGSHPDNASSFSQQPGRQICTLHLTNTNLCPN